MIHTGHLFFTRQPATPPGSPSLSSQEYNKLNCQAESPVVLQPTPDPTTEDLEQLESKLVGVELSLLAEEIEGWRIRGI